jgi:anthranilate/para-aminobenzoate synthase component I
MIVDLLRNDIGKICNYGSVKVKDLFKINSYATVHQMVSCVYGELKNNVKYIDILKALCPGGSITGAPKESSMKIIDSLESYDREIYTGGIGYIDQQSNMYFNIAIRTMIAQNDILNYSVGGGIVWDSIASQELDEAHLKSKILDKFIKN